MNVFSVQYFKKVSIISFFGLLWCVSTALAAGEPIASYDFNQGSGTVLNDISGNGNSGTLTSGPAWVVGKNSGGLSFNGASSYVSMGDVNALDGLTRLAVGGWIKTTASGEKHIVGKSHCDGITNGGPFELGTGFFSTGKATFLVYRNGGGYYYVQSANNVNDGAWHHIVGVYDGTNLLMYVDGVQSGQLSLPGITLSSTSNSLELGGRCNGNAYIWNGSVDDVRIYNRALTASEVVTDMNTPVGQAPAPDTTAPTVSLTAPLNNATVSGSTVTVSANAADNIAVAGVQFLLDGNSLGAEDAAAPHSIIWDATTASTGSHTLSARARDAAGNTTFSSDVAITVVPLPGAVLGYAFNEGSGAVATDSTGTGNSGTLINGPTWTSGKNGSGLQFDGTNDYIDATHTPSLNITSNKISLSAWVNPNSATGIRMIMGKPVSATAHTSPYFSYALYANANRVTFYLRTGTTNRTLTTTQTLNLNVWNHVTAVYNGATMKIYLDGVERATLNATGNLASYTTPLRVGANGARQQAWSGLLDDVRVYGRNLSLSEIQRDMSTPVAPTGVDTIAPVLTQITAVATPTNDSTPNYTFSSSEAGAVAYSGACSSATVNAVSGDNTITFASLADGVLSNCAIQVSDTAGNQSNILSIPSFTVDTLAPTALSVSSDTTAGTYTTGQVIDIDVMFSEVVTSTGDVTVTLETGTTDQACTFTLTSATTGTCNYTVQSGDASLDLDMNSLAGAVADQTGNVLTNFTPAVALATNESIIIDTTPPADNTAPSTPTDLVAVAISSSQINLSWTASTDNTAVTGYQVYRDGVSVGQATGTTYADSGLTTSTAYSYMIAAFDAAGNFSPQTTGVNATTFTPTTVPNLVAAYNFDEASGTTLTDQTTNANNATLTNDPVWVIGKNSGGLSFDGTNEYAQVPNTSSINVTGSALTLEVWIKPADGSNDSVILGKPYTDGEQSSPYYQYGLEIDRNGGDQIDFLLATGTSTLTVFSFSRPVIYDQWNHVAVTYDGTTIRGYLNGTDAGSVSTSGALVARPTPLRFGVDATLSQPYQGVLDDIRLYSRALSVTEIVSDMMTPAGEVAPDTTAPSTPTNVTATPTSSTQIDLSWTASTDNTAVTGYSIYRDGTLITNVTSGTAYSDTGLTASTTYSYRIAAYDVAGNVSTLSTAVNGTTQATPDTTAPTVPTNLTATPASSTEINLSWTASTDAVGVTSYEVFRNATSIATVTAPTTTYADTGLTPATTYTYTVRARDAAGNNSSETAAVNGTTGATLDTDAPTLPTNVTATAVGLNQIDLSWTASTDNVAVTGYQIERCTGVNCSSFAEITSQTGTTYSDSSLTASTVYRYRVRATDAAGNFSSYSATVSATTQATPDTTAPTVTLTAPANNATVSGTITVSATASDDTGVVGVQFRADSTTNIGAEDTTSPYSVSFDTNTISNGVHLITAVARDVAGNSTSSGSALVTVSNASPDTTAPTVPTNLTATPASSTEINLSWTASTDAVGVTSYEVFRNATSIATVTAPTTTYADTGLTPATTYTYTVRARDAAGNNSSETAAVNGTTNTPVVTPNLIAAYSFDEGSGTTVTDRSGNANTATLTNGPAWAIGKNSGGLTFDGANDYVQAPNSASLNVTGSALTLEAWIKPIDSGSDTVILGKPYMDGAQNSPYYQYGLEIDGNGGDQIDFYLGTGTSTLNSFSFSRPVVYGQWNHVAVTYDGTTMRGYLDGVAAGSAGASGAIISRTTPFRMGVDAQLGQPYQGTLDDVRLYNRALSGAEIATDMATPVGEAAAPDTTAPTILSVSSDAPSGTYATGQSIDVDVVFSESITSTGAVTVTLETGTIDRTCTFVVTNMNTGTCDYIVQAGDSSLDLEVNTISGNIADQSGNVLSNFVPGTSFSANEAIVVDTTPDTTAPSVPTNLIVSSVSNTQLNLSWAAATDNIGVVTYEVFRDGVSLITVMAPAVNYQNTGLTPATTHTYTVRAKDAAGNVSAESVGVAGTTQSGSATMSYSTNFDLTESPISEGGAWNRAANSFTSVVTENGIAHGTNGVTNGYDDSYSFLSGFGPDYTAEAVIQRSAELNTAVTHEVELFLRGSDDADNARGYECLFAYYGGFQLMRWNGQMGDYAVLPLTGGTGGLGRELQTGDVVKCSIVGNTITAYINDTLVGVGTDSAFPTGQPGISFFTRPGGNSAHLGFTSYSVTAQ